VRFINRQDAGRRLADKLQHYAEHHDILVFGLARGGVPIAYEVAVKLNLPLDVLIVRKLGVPAHEELAFGAIASVDTIVLNDDIVKSYHVDMQTQQRVIHEQKKLLTLREARYRGNKPYPDLIGKTIILVDDGIATGATMRVAVKALRQKHPASITVATPVVSPSTRAELEHLADQCVSVIEPPQLMSIGQWYDDFSQTTDEEVVRCLK